MKSIQLHKTEMTFIRLTSKQKLILLILIACMLSITNTTSCQITYDSVLRTGTALYNCDPRCWTYSAGMFCCIDSTHTTNNDCSYGCNTDQTTTLVGKVYQWPEPTPTRCDSYCPPRYFFYSTDPSGTQCRTCHSWCFDCTDLYQYTCTSCDNTAFRLNSTGCYNMTSQTYTTYNPCPDGYYGLHIQKVCVPCTTGCATCAIYLTWEMPGTGAGFSGTNYDQNNINCTGDPLCGYTLQCYSCISGYTYLNGACYQNTQCLTYSYYTSTGLSFTSASCNCFTNYQPIGSSICLKCHILCLSCSGSTSSSCLTCPTGSSNTTATSPTSCSYNSTYLEIQNWVSGTPATLTGGWSKTGASVGSNVNQMSCTSANYIFGYYGYNNNGTLYYSSSKTAGINLFPSDASLVYSKSSLTAHYGIHIRATLLFIDQWTNIMAIIFTQNGINQMQFTYRMQGIAGQYLCGLNYDDHLDVVDDWFKHTSSSINALTIKANKVQAAWGIKEIIIHVMKCHISCSSCKGPTINDCSACPTNQTLVNGICVCDSANGYFNISGNSSINCTKDCGTLYQNPYTYTCVSACSWPYAFGFLNGTSRYQCLVGCPTNYSKNYTNNMCVSSCYISSITDPASNYYLFGGADQICNRTCPNGTYGDPMSGSCVRTCPSYNSTVNDGYFSSGSFCYERCPSLTLFAYLPQRACLSSCPSGHFKNYVLKNGTNSSICEQQCSVTLSGQYKYGDNATGYCTNYCSTGTYGDIDTNLCLKVCNTSAFAQTLLVSGVYERLCVINCSLTNNLYGNPQTGFCVVPTDCPTNYYADPLTYQCTRNCSGDLYFGDNSTKKCITGNCSNNGFKDNQTKICLKTCTSNDSTIIEYGDPVTRYCVANCYGAYYADNQYNMECVLICSATPASTFGLNNVCVRNCSATTWADIFNPSRTCTTSCYGNSTFQSYGLNDTRVCVSICPDYQFADISSGVGLCNFGCPVNPNSSLTGLFGNIVNNKCQTQCPSPFFGDQTGNRTCVLKCPWPYFAQYCTQSGNTFTISTKRQCQLACTCGWSDNATQLCVWNSSGCANFTFAHETNHKCVISSECTGYGDPVSRYCINPCFKDTTVIYFADNSTKMCVTICPNTPNYFGDNSTQECVLTCPNSTVRDPQGMRRCVNLTDCSVSPVYLYGDQTKDLCVNPLNCSDGYYADNNTHQCIQICPGPTYLYADNVTKQCVSICQLGWYALNVSAGQGICSLSCPQDQWADNKTVSCTTRCSASTYGVNYTGSWSAFSSSFSYYGTCQNQCPEGQFARDADNLCVSNCGSGLWGDYLSKTCKTSPFDCPAGYYADNTKHQCVVSLNCSKVSGVQYVADNITKSCVSKCPNTTLNYADLNKFLCVAKCPKDYYGHNETLNCQTNCTYPNASAYDGSFADSQLNICVKQCSTTPISTFGQNITYTCVEPRDCPTDTWAQVTVSKRKCLSPCPSPNMFNANPRMYGDNITRTCVTSCPTYTFADLSVGYGLCVYVCPVLGNGTLQFADNSTKSCVAICPASNYTFGDNSTVSCVYTCPNGTFAQPFPYRYCVKTCSLGTWGQTVKYTCVDSPLLCPTINGTLYYADNTTTMCVTTCPAATNSTPDYWGQNTTRSCLTSCLLPSGVQSGFKWNKTRVCIKQCPDQIGSEGSYSDQGMCYYVCMTANYYRDPQYNRSCQSNCTFSPNKQYADNTTMKCMTKCPTMPLQLYAYDPTKTCESTCPNSYRKYLADKTCVQICPNGTLFNPDTYQCVSQCPLTTSTNQTLFADPSLSEPKCVINTDCPSGYYADTNIGYCVQNCSMNQWIYGKDCVKICPNGYYGNPNNVSCVLPQYCPTDYYADNVTITCVSQCSGSYADSTTYSCVFQCPKVGSTVYYADPSTRKCSTTCTNTSFIPLIKNIQNQLCVSQCDPGLFMDPFKGSCQSSCTQNYYADNSSHLCVKICPVSPNLFGQNATYTCVQNCLVSTQYKYIAGRVCVTTCPSGTFRNNITRICQTTCTSYTYADTNSSYCVFNCTPNYAYDPTNQCKSACAAPFYKDPTTFKCVLQCPTYPTQYLRVINGTDRKCDVNCPSGQYRNFQTLTCTALCSAAPIMFADSTTGNCLAVCSANFFGYTVQRKCLSKCPVGMYANNLTRMCVSKCDPVYSLFGDPNLNTPACVTTCSSGSYADPFTQTCVTGCINFPKMYAFDNGDTTNPVRTCIYSCPYPYIADNSTSKCRLVCNSLSFPYIDQAAQQCVKKCTSQVYPYTYMPSNQTVNGQCVKFCPNGTFALLSNNSCVTKCPNGLYGSTTNNTCYESCSIANNEYADPYNNRCVQECYHLNTYYSYADEFSRTCVQTCPKDKGLVGDRIIWKCVKRCSNLSQFTDPSGVCVGQCPPNYFADPVSQTCVSNCSISTLSYGDTSTRTCVSQCLTTTLYADDSTRLCVNSTSCPSGYFGFNTTRVCVATCPTTPNLFGDPITKTCVPVCQASPVKYFADYVSRTCVTRCPSVPQLYAQNNTQICISSCPNNTFADNYTRICTSICSNKTFADNLTSKCVSICPIEPNYFASNYTWECVLTCPITPTLPMYADNSTRSCVYYCPKGIINTYADDSTSRCVDICPNNTYNQNSTQKCVTQCLTGFADPKTKFCIAICPRYTYGDNKTLSCVTGCPIYNGLQTYAQDANNLCMNECLSMYGTFRDNSTNRCVRKCPINASYFADLSQRECTATCPDNPLTYADFSTRYCVSKCPSAPALFSVSTTNRICVAVCPNMTWSDNNTRSCLQICITSPETFGDNSTWACVTSCPTKPYTFADNFTHTCVSICPSDPDYYGDNATRKCVFYCPNGTFADPTTRTCVTTCPQEYFGQNSTRRCVKECPWKQFADNLTRLCLAKCVVDPILYGNPDTLKCVTQCPSANDSFGNPLTQQCVNYQSDGTSGCPVTYFADNLTRLCVQVCPMANETYADNSTWKCVSQCPIITLLSGVTYNTYSDNSTMRCVDVCPSYPDFYGQPYSRTCVHFCLKPASNYSGSFSDNSTRTCVQTCPSLPDYFSDNSTGRCVFYCPRYPLTFADNSTRRCVTQCPSDPDIYGDLKTLRCVPQCPRDQNTFADYSTRLCVSTCPSNPPLFAQNNTLICVSNCPNNSYSDNASRICVKVCPRFPQTYADPSTNQCVSTCPSYPDLYADPNTQQCIIRCPTQFYAQNTTRKCLRSCLFIFNYTNYADNLTNRCVDRCPASQLTYGDNQTQTCVKQCPSDPFTYADNITQTCVTICNNQTNGGYADNYTRICVQKCPDLSYGDITTRYCVRYCPALWYAYTITNLCVQKCPSPYFADNSTWRCVLKCPVGQNLFGQKINNTCVGVCPEGTYASEQNQQCVLRCPNSSQTILKYNTWGFNDTNYCVNQCPVVPGASLYGYPVDQVCVDICPDPYYPNITDHLCYKCPEECASCHYPQLCITCVANHYLYSGACVQSCPTFPVITYANPNRVCGTAYQCTQGFYALNATKSCVQSCPAGYFVSISTQTCDACMRGCLTCLNAAQCIVCNKNVSVWSNYKCYMFCSARNRFYGTTGCVAQCPNGTYLNITTCQSCSSTCKTCIVTAQNCLICANGLYQSNGICVSTCPTNTVPKLVNNSQTCVACSGTCTTKPLTFSTTQYSSGSQYTVQVQFSETVNIKDQLSSVIKLSQKKTSRVLATSYDNLDYTIVDNGNGLYSFVFNNYNPSSNAQLQVQITNPSAIVGSSGQIPSTTRSSLDVDTSIIYSTSDYNKNIDGTVQAFSMFAFILLIITFGMEHSIWMPMYDYLQLVMAFILINVNYPPNLLQSVFQSFASAFSFLPNFFAKSYSKAPFSKNYINNNIYAVIQDSSFLRVMGQLYFIFMMLGIMLAIIFILSKKCFFKPLKKWCKQFIKEIFWKKHLFGLVSILFLPIFLFAIFNMRLYSYFSSQSIQGFSIFNSYLFMIGMLIPIIYWLYKMRKIIKTHPVIYLMLQKAYNFILYQDTVLIQNKNHFFTHQSNQVDLSNAREPKINQLLVFPFPIQTKVGPWQITQPFFAFLHKFMTAMFLALAFTNPVIQIILLILANLSYLVYFIIRRPFYRVKNRQYNNEIYIHNLLVIVLIQIALLVLSFIGAQISKQLRVLVGDVICGIIIEGGLVNIIYFAFRTYNYHYEKAWKPFVRSQIFKINYTVQHLQWTKEYQQKQKKLASEVKTRQQFLQAIKIETGQALANMVRDMSISTNTKQKLKALNLRPNKGNVIAKQYSDIMINLANDKQKSQKSIASSERLSKAERKKVRDFIFGEKHQKMDQDKYEKLNIIEEKSDILMQGVSQQGQENQQTEYEYEFIEEQFPQGTPMQQILKDCKKGDVVVPF